MEDGFVRSVGLGSDLIRPLSLVLDERGIYFDPTQPSDLEHILNTAEFSGEELARAYHVREFIVAHGITKYNLEPRETANWGGEVPYGSESPPLSPALSREGSGGFSGEGWLWPRGSAGARTGGG